MATIAPVLRPEEPEPDEPEPLEGLDGAPVPVFEDPAPPAGEVVTRPPVVPVEVEPVPVGRRDPVTWAV